MKRLKIQPVVTLFCITILSSFWMGSSMHLSAQNVIRLNSGGTFTSSNGVVIHQTHPSSAQPVVSGTATTSSASGGNSELKTKRMAKFQKLDFDRRRSAILTTWATPEEKKEEDKETKKEDKKKDDKKEEVKKAKENNKDDKPVKASKPVTDAERKKQEAEKKKKEAEEKKKKEAEEKKKKDDENLKQLDKDLIKLKRDVTLGEWKEVEKFLLKISLDEAKIVYGKMLSSFQRPKAIQNSRFPQLAEKSVMNVEDMIVIVQMSPEKLDTQKIAQLASLMRISISNGHAIEEYVSRFKDLTKDSIAVIKKEEKEKIKKEKEKLKEEAIKEKTPDDKKKTAEKKEEKREPVKIGKRDIARLLSNSGNATFMKEFLPELKEAQEQDDREALNLLSRYYLGIYSKERKKEFLEDAWEVTQAALAVGDINKQNKEEALKRAVDLAPKIKEELGQAWLDESFTSRPERGMEILSTIGSVLATSLESRRTDPSFRLKSLELQNSAVKTLMKANPDKGKEWKETLQLLAINWLNEAEISRTYDRSTQRGPRLIRDYFGNFYYGNNHIQGHVQQNNDIRAIAVGKVIDLIPSDDWLGLLDSSLLPKFTTIIPQLYLKVHEEEEAFPYIEKLAKTHPEKAKTLVEEFLRVWTTNHNPNQSQRYTNPYMFGYGFNRRAQGIPLTRSKQKRSLADLSKWIKKIQALPIKDIDEKLIKNAFVSVHSSAEVFQLDSIENIFGSVDHLKPKTLATLIQTMRSNLGGVWRVPTVQKKAKTNRKQKDIQTEVLKGYEIAHLVLKKGIEKSPESWELQAAQAALDHDANEYHQKLKESTKYSGYRKAALDHFKKASELYAASLKDLPEEEQSAEVYTSWFYTSLGSPDLNNITHETSTDFKQIPLIREAINSLPGESANKHMDLFANTLFTRLSSVSPGVKFRFLKAGFEIVGDNERAREAKKVYDYYNDLVTEIKLDTAIDGNDVVGHKEPFGIFVNIRHTKQIERESGGFARYLQNQNRGYWSYNYGRPNQNYRDKFEEAATEALKEHFEILSITFQSEDVHSKASPEYGWRITPYAYILLKPLGSEVDKIPSLKLDLDFLDTSGYAVIPVNSAAIPIDASSEKGNKRPIKKLEITQTLDEREAEDGKLKLEVKATGNGIVPALDQLVNLDPTEFDVVSTEDEGVSVSHFDKESDQTEIVSERSWMISMEAKKGLTKHPESFEFGKPTEEIKKTVYHRYVDADLADVEQVISLEEQYGDPKQAWIGLALVIFAVLLVIGIGIWLTSRKTEEVQAAKFEVPDHITPFTVIGLLKNIEQNNGLSQEGKTELGSSINRLERFYFQDEEKEEPNLDEIVEHWVRKTS